MCLQHKSEMLVQSVSQIRFFSKKTMHIALERIYFIRTRRFALKARWKLACGTTTGIRRAIDSHSERVLLTVESPSHLRRGNRLFALTCGCTAG